METLTVVVDSTTRVETLTMGRKDYDPFDVVPKFLAQVREAIAATASI